MTANEPDPDWLADLTQAMRSHYGVDEGDARRPEFAEDAPYRVLDELAHGGMGSVLRVHDGRLDRTLAMKVVRGDRTADDAALLSEARVLGKLQHPGIVPVHDAGTDTQGRAWFTMALVEGESLATLLARRQAGLAADWSVPRVLDLLIKACDTVGYAHARGVAHGDLKPGNVMIGRFGEVYVLDWGVARPLTAGAVPSPAGTPEYMAPEGEGHAGAAGDVFALGAILHEVLTGSPRPGPGAASVPRQHAPLWAVSRKAMERDPAARYPTMVALAADLRAFLEDRVVRAWRSGPLAELTAWYRRHRTVARTALAALVLIAALGVWFLVTLRHERDLVAAAAESARASLREIADLAVVERIDDLRRRADAELWPLAPERVPALRAWLGDARGLGDAQRALRARLLGADAAASADLGLRFRRRLLSRTVADLERFLEEAPPTAYVDSNVASVAQRLDLIAMVAARAQAAGAEQRWRDAAAALAADPRFAGVVLPPQFDLLPLGCDPRSGLLEFVHLPSGEPPARDEHGHLRPDAGSGIVLVLLPPGTFHMGAARSGEHNVDPDAEEMNESPVHAVTLDAFFVARHEMTQAQWQRVTGANPSNHDARSVFVDDHKAPLHPVENVTWLECRSLLPRLGLELPTEAQWEYAARAGTGTPFPAGAAAAFLAAGQANLADRARRTALGAQCGAWHADLDDGFVMHAPVGSYASSAFGLCDMAGNVWEWCRDEYVAYGRAPRPGDGARPCDERPRIAMYRGGAFDQLAVEARCANRAGAPPDVRQFTVGVRAVRALAAR